MTRRTEGVMGDIPFTVDVPGHVEPALFDAIFAELRSIDRTFSPFIADSAVSRINAWTLSEPGAPPEVREVLALCRRYERLTDGYFSAWHSGCLEPCGLVKGWAIDRVCRMIARAGHAAYFVDGGGDVVTCGERVPGRPWRIGIRHPVRRDRVAAVIEAANVAVATSGSYERGGHICDPHTGRAATELVSMTVIGPDIVAADVYATAAFAMGRGGLAFVERLTGYEAFAIDAELWSASTSGFAALAAAEAPRELG